MFIFHVIFFETIFFAHLSVVVLVLRVFDITSEVEENSLIFTIHRVKTVTSCGKAYKMVTRHCEGRRSNFSLRRS